MVAAAVVAVGLVDEGDLHVCRVGSACVHFLHEAAEVAGGRIVLVAGCDELGDGWSGEGEVVCAGAEDANRVLV